MTNTTNESEAMEVWRGAVNAYDGLAEFLPGAPRFSIADRRAARVIATALEARDADLRAMREALKHIATCNREPVTDRADHYRRVACRALTKGDTTHDQ